MSEHKYPILARYIADENDVNIFEKLSVMVNMYNMMSYYPIAREDNKKVSWTKGPKLGTLDYDKFIIKLGCDRIVIEYKLYYSPYIEDKIEHFKSWGFTILERGEYIVDDEGIFDDCDGSSESEMQEDS